MFDPFTTETMCLPKQYFNQNELFPFIPWNFASFNLTITVFIVINFKTLNFKNVAGFDFVHSKGR